MEWTSDDGRPLQGVLIKPGGYEPGRRYPVLVYYYEISSDRLYDFNEIVVNHRPCFPVYAGRHGYAVFLPDIRSPSAGPGCRPSTGLVPGVRKLIDMASPIRRPSASMAIPGAGMKRPSSSPNRSPRRLRLRLLVGNMTSAYSGIR